MGLRIKYSSPHVLIVLCGVWPEGKKKRLLNGDTDDGGAQRRSCWEELLEEEGRS